MVETETETFYFGLVIETEAETFKSNLELKNESSTKGTFLIQESRPGAQQPQPKQILFLWATLHYVQQKAQEAQKK